MCLHGVLNPLVARFRLLRFVDPAHNVPAQRRSDRVERRQRSRRAGQFRRQIRRHDGLAWFAIEQHRHFDGGARVDLKLSPDLAVHVKAIVAAASRHQRIFKRQPIDPSVHRNMFRISAGLFLHRFANVARHIDTAHDPDLLDLRDEDVRIFFRGHFVAMRDSLTEAACSAPRSAEPARRDCRADRAAVRPAST